MADHTKLFQEENAVVGLLTTLIERQDTLIEHVSVVDKKLDGHMSREEAVTKQFTAALPSRPDGSPDVDGHREFHSAVIEEKKARAQLYRELRAEVAKKGVLGLLAVLGFLILYWWTGEVKK